MSQWNDVQRRLRRVHRFAKLMDDQFVIPGTGVRFGWDALAGLVPGIGDAATSILGLWLIGEAARLKAPRGMLLRMVMNWLIDSSLGAVPLAGDVFDVFWKSNRRNAELLQQYMDRRSAGGGS